VQAKVDNEQGCCVQNMLEWFSGTSWQAGQNRVTVVQPGKYERRYQLSCEFLTDETSDLPQTTQLVETAAGDLGHVCFRRKLRVQLDAKVADRLVMQRQNGLHNTVVQCYCSR